MNKIYKVVKNRQGNSRVVSELAKGKGKSKKLSLLVKTALTGALSLCLAGNALAEIRVDNTQDAVISNSGNRVEDGKFTIRTSDEDIIVNNSGNLTSTGNDSSPLFYYLKGGKVVDITNTGNLETNNNWSRGIFVQAQYGIQDREIKINNQGNITINGNASGGIVASTASDQITNPLQWKTKTSVNITNSGDININSDAPILDKVNEGRYPVGIIGVALSGNEGDITINNSGNINSPVHAIRVWQQGVGNINIDNSGDLTITDSTTNWGSGIYATTSIMENTNVYAEAVGDINIKNSGKISSNNAKNIELIRTELSAKKDGSGKATGNINIDNQGQLVAKGENTKGIYALMRGSADNTGTITINNNGLVDTAGNDAKAIVVESRDGDININLDSNSNIIGGGGKDGVAIDMTSAAHRRDLTKEQPALQTVNNKGVISATNDRTIVAHRSRTNGGKTIINNDGDINGFVDLSATKNINTTSDENQPNYQNVDSNGEVTFNNNGTWNIKDSTGLSSGGQVGTVINVIGTNTQNGLINNTGTIQIVDPEINSAVLKNSDVINSGVIDLGKNSADTTLTINGNYTGENGQLNIYTDVENGKSDK
ncbi:hypothetical protein J3U68_10595, partial [Snodgrassella sp. B3882]|uniref:ESPR-type extended signal peptide-containing protein n=1 Tax=Snodgrassella sp. B3882 TaxID=2818037 RepID=UPI00226ABA12